MVFCSPNSVQPSVFTMVFSSHERLKKRTGNSGVPRQSYLRQMVAEFRTTSSKQCKEQIMANLANFAYDPINYEFLRNLGVLDLFLEQLRQPSTSRNLLEFAIGGISNLCLDPVNRETLLNRNAIPTISASLLSDHKPVVLSALTLLVYLLDPYTKHLIAQGPTVAQIHSLLSTESREVQNMATIFLADLEQLNTSGK